MPTGRQSIHTESQNNSKSKINQTTKGSAKRKRQQIKALAARDFFEFCEPLLVSLYSFIDSKSCAFNSILRFKLF